MSQGVTVTVSWIIKPECAEAFAEALRGMFPVTRTYEGFRNIRLLRGESDPNQFLLIEEWDEVRHFSAYGQFRADKGDTAALLAMTAGPPQVGAWALDPLAAAEA